MRLLALAAALATALVVPAAYAVTAKPPARVQVTSSEFDYVLSRAKVRQGRAIIELVNLGEDPHDLAIKRIGGKRRGEIAKTLPGEVGEWEGRLRRGRYRLWCTIEGHRAMGMRAVLRVR